MWVFRRAGSQETTTNEFQISDAIRRFGVNDTSTTLVVVKVLSGLLDEESKKSILTAMQAVVEGELLPLSSLSDFTDWIAVKKVQLVDFIYECF